MVQTKPFALLQGRQIPLIILSNDTLCVELMPYGATVRAIRVPDRNGNSTDVCLGYDTLEDYRKHDAYFGATVGRCANRIGGARFTLCGEEYALSANEGDNILHGGHEGFDKKVWDYTCGENSVTFSLDSPDGDEGFPGNLHVQVTYTLEKDTLTVRFLAQSDRDTVVSLTNHAYFNLAGHEGGPVDDHQLTLRAGHYTPTAQGNIPTGEIAPVEGTVWDLRGGAVLGERWHDEALGITRGYDHNFALDGGELPAAQVYCPRTGIALELSTTLEGVQLYTSGFLTDRTGKNGAVYGQGHGICLEPQHFPDAVNHPAFPSPVLKAGATYDHSIQYRFFTR